MPSGSAQRQCRSTSTRPPCQNAPPAPAPASPPPPTAARRPARAARAAGATCPPPSAAPPAAGSRRCAAAACTRACRGPRPARGRTRRRRRPTLRRSAARAAAPAVGTRAAGARRPRRPRAPAARWCECAMQTSGYDLCLIKTARACTSEVVAGWWAAARGRGWLCKQPRTWASCSRATAPMGDSGVLVFWGRHAAVKERPVASSCARVCVGGDVLVMRVRARVSAGMRASARCATLVRPRAWHVHATAPALPQHTPTAPPLKST